MEGMGNWGMGGGRGRQPVKTAPEAHHIRMGPRLCSPSLPLPADPPWLPRPLRPSPAHSRRSSSISSYGLNQLFRLYVHAVAVLFAVPPQFFVLQAQQAPPSAATSTNPLSNLLVWARLFTCTGKGEGRRGSGWNIERLSMRTRKGVQPNQRLSLAKTTTYLTLPNTC